jgi:type II secretion system protein H
VTVRLPATARAGFTLIEIVVVLLIIAVATAVSVPALLPPREPGELESATSRIEALFRLARDSAGRSGMPMVVAFDSATGDARLYPEREVQPEHEAYDVALRAPGTPRRRAGGDDAGWESLELPQSVRVELPKARAHFTFRPAGAAFGDTLALRQGGTWRIITVNPWNGHAVVH